MWTYDTAVAQQDIKRRQAEAIEAKNKTALGKAASKMDEVCDLLSHAMLDYVDAAGQHVDNSKIREFWFEMFSIRSNIRRMNSL